MLPRIVEVSNDSRHLSLYRGFMLVTQSGAERKEVGRVALDDMGALIANAHGLSYTNNLLVALAERGVPFVLCGSNHNVAGMLWPIDGHHQQAHRFEAQIDCKEPARKRMWAAIVKAKLQNQAAVLMASGSNATGLLRLSKMVKSGDAGNTEAQGARQYWQALLGSNFRRNQEADGLNALLNYGYTVLRAATARAVVAAGLHPSIGLHHSHDNNAMRLVDDLMEPFRPTIDWHVWQMQSQGMDSVDDQTKRTLVKCLYMDLVTDLGKTPVIVAIQKLATSVAQVMLKERSKLDLPMPGIPVKPIRMDGE
ncbi:MAG: type II CRISPR-associated endonuclease Cas1 [Alphaproteobacteria bacterium]|nr:type II CRISPR-associated endonuclease Cas1 [Alphaproteobacteria bacterium]